MEVRMKSEKARGLKGRVVITLSHDEATQEVRLYRGGRLGLASHAPYGHLFKPIGQQLRSMPSMPMVTRMATREP